MQTYHQLTQTQRYQIYALRKTKHTHAEIAEVIGVHKSSVSRVRGSGILYTVTVNPGSGNGTIRLGKPPQLRVIESCVIKEHTKIRLVRVLTRKAISRLPCSRGIPHLSPGFVSRLRDKGTRGICGQIRRAEVVVELVEGKRVVSPPDDKKFYTSFSMIKSHS